MSYTEMFAVPAEGSIYSVAEFKNAFRSAWHVWSEMAGAYLSKDASHLMFSDRMQRVWDLSKREDIPLDYRIVMLFTFDDVMVKRENFIRLAEAMESFAKRFGAGSLLLQAAKLKELADDIGIVAVCWNQTSVNADTWCIVDESLPEEDQRRPYDISKDENHWFLFDEPIE